MSHTYLTRKNVVIACFVMGFGAQYDVLANHHALYPVPWSTLFLGAVTGLLLPGGIVAVVIRDLTGTPFNFPMSVYLSLAFWFFPVARLRRWFGMHDALGEGPRRRPVLVRGVAFALDAINKRLFGRRKTGGWA